MASEGRGASGTEGHEVAIVFVLALVSLLVVGLLWASEAGFDTLSGADEHGLGEGHSSTEALRGGAPQSERPSGLRTAAEGGVDKSGRGVDPGVSDGAVPGGTPDSLGGGGALATDALQPQPGDEAGAERGPTAPGMCRLEGRVLIAGQLAPAGHVVELRRSEDFQTVEVQSTLSDAAGGFTFGPLLEAHYYVSAYGDEVIPNTVSFECRGDTDTAQVLLELQPGDVRIFGLVTDTTDNALGGAEISIVEPGEPADELFSNATFVLADESGRFSFAAKQGRRYTLYTNAPGYRFAYEELRETGVSEVGPLIFRLEPEPRALGQVLRADGSPAARARVSVGPLTAGVMPTETDAAGRFNLPLRKEIAFRLCAKLESEIGCEAQEHAAMAPADRVEDIVIQLAAGRTITGLVQDVEGEGVANVKVIFRDRELGYSGQVRTDDTGRFEVLGVLADAEVELFAMARRGTPRVRNLPERVPPGVSEVMLRYELRPEKKPKTP